MANKVVGRVWMMRPMCLNRPRIMMQSYEGTVGVRRMSRSLRACSSLSNRRAPALLRNARMYTEATIRRALDDGGAMCTEEELRDSTKDMYSDSFSGVGMYPDPKNAQRQRSFALFARGRAFGTSLPFAIAIVPKCR